MDIGNKTVGVVGGGQLGRMMAYPAHRLGVKLICLDAAGPESPCAKICGFSVHGGLKDREKTLSLVSEHHCDIVTTEIEHVNVDALDELVKAGTVMEPSPSTIRIIQDKYIQKEHFAKKGIALPPYMKTDSLEEVKEAGRKMGYPLMLKARGNSYDGKGNYVVKKEEDAEEAFKQLSATSDRGCYAEGWATFTMELACMVVRGLNGEVRAYPVVETEQKDSICHITVCPARITEKSRVLAEKIALDAVSSFEGRGIYGVEMFLMPDGTVLLNEIAPRPHNTGHYTIEATDCCQFENHLRAVTGMPLGSTAMKVKSAVMLNLLGEADGKAGMDALNDVCRRSLQCPGATAHWYGKDGCKKNRKIGHITVCAESVTQALARVNFIRGITQTVEPAPEVGIIMGSDSDLPCMKDAAEQLELFGIPYEMQIVSAHRTPQKMFDYARSAPDRGIKVIIAGAGGAAHLPGMVAAMTPLPVIGVPVKSSMLSGNDSLLSIVQMPKGVPVATVAIHNAANAGLLAARTIGAGNRVVLDKMQAFLNKQEEEVLAKSDKLEKIGHAAYLQHKGA